MAVAEDLGTQTTVSVIIPTWNRAGTLVAAVKSALAQTHPPLEVLICDDGSTDDSHAQLQALADPRIVWLPGERAGRPAVPRNRGIAAAKGEWLAFLDSDDEWLPRKLERQLAMASERTVLAVCTDAWRVRPGSTEASPLLGGGSEILAFTDLLGANRIICSSALIHRSVFSVAGGFPPSSALKAIEDYALWLRVTTVAPFGYLAEPLLTYRDDPGNSVRAGDPDNWTQRQRVLGDFLAWSKPHDAALVQQARLAAAAELRKARLMARVARLSVLLPWRPGRFGIWTAVRKFFGYR